MSKVQRNRAGSATLPARFVLARRGYRWAAGRGVYAVHLMTSLHRDEARWFYERVDFERTRWRYVRRTY